MTDEERQAAIDDLPIALSRGIDGAFIARCPNLGVETRGESWPEAREAMIKALEAVVPKADEVVHLWKGANYHVLVEVTSDEGSCGAVGAVTADVSRDDPRGVSCRECLNLNWPGRPKGEASRPPVRDPTLASERLIAFWGLEAEGLTEWEEHDCRRAARWLREDEKRAGQILEKRERLSGRKIIMPVPDFSGEPVIEDRRADFLRGFLREFPSRGVPATPLEREAIGEAADRITALVVDRYERRFGCSPPAEAVRVFRRDLSLLWQPGQGDLGKMADDMAAFREKHWAAWCLRFRVLGAPKYPLTELKKIAAGITGRLAQEDELGG